jgi:EAL domain-containing protein (putative c-di-GMP-specific phosphodiesterase class I)
VETAEQRELLINKGCVYFQGYFFGRPIPIAEFEFALKQV